MSGHYVALRLRASLMYWPVELGRYVLKSGWVTAYSLQLMVWNGVHLKRGCENLTSVVR